MTDPLLELVALQRETNALLRRLITHRESAADIESAWREEIGPAPMTTAKLLRWIDDDPNGPVALAVEALVDLSAPGRAISLGRLLARQPWLLADPRGGVLTYRLGN